MGRIIAVGDRHQCQPPETMVLKVITRSGREKSAIHTWVPIHTLTNKDRVVSWGNCGGGGPRWGKIKNGRAIEVASREYAGKLLVVSAFGHSTRVTPSHKFLIRLNDCARDWHVVYLMYRPDRGFRVGQCKLYSTHGSPLSSCGGGTHLLNRARQEGAERLWILTAFPTLKEARTHETLCSLRYQIPTTTYELHAEYGDYQNIEAIFAQFGRTENGCLEAHGRWFEYPLWKAGENGSSKSIGINAWTRHYACNLIPKLMNINTSGEVEVPIDRVSLDSYVGKVYSLNVDKDHTYLADGLVTCNSIYGFRGAHSASMDELEKRFQCRTLPLSVSYRCPIAVVLKAREWVERIEWAPATCKCGHAVNLHSPAGNCLESVPWGENGATTGCSCKWYEEGRAGAVDGYVGEEGTDWRGQCEMAMGAPLRNEHGELPGEICCQRATGGECHEHREARLMAERLEGISKWRSLSDFRAGDAILCRLTRPLVEVAFALVRARIPVRMAGRDIGKGLVSLCERIARKDRQMAPQGADGFETALDAYLSKQRLKLAQKQKWAELGRLEDQVATIRVFMEGAESAGGANGDATGDAVVAGVGLVPETVGELIAQIEGLFTDNGDMGRMVTCSTVHRAKGLEWERVFILNARELMPWKWARQDWELAQERSLCYVACTRARRELRYITSHDLGLGD